MIDTATLLLLVRWYTARAIRKFHEEVETVRAAHRRRMMEVDNG